MYCMYTVTYTHVWEQSYFLRTNDSFCAQTNILFTHAKICPLHKRPFHPHKSFLHPRKFLYGTRRLPMPCLTNPDGIAWSSDVKQKYSSPTVTWLANNCRYSEKSACLPVHLRLTFFAFAFCTVELRTFRLEMAHSFLLSLSTSVLVLCLHAWTYYIALCSQIGYELSQIMLHVLGHVFMCIRMCASVCVCRTIFWIVLAWKRMWDMQLVNTLHSYALGCNDHV